MIYLAIAALLAWLLYSWQIGIGLGVMCGIIALFYGAALPGNADAKVIRTFSVLVLVLSVIMVGVLTQKAADHDADQPKLCSGVPC